METVFLLRYGPRCFRPHYLAVSGIISVRGTLAWCWSSRRAAGSWSDCVQPPCVPAQGLERAAYTSIMWIRKELQQLFYITETGHGWVRLRGEKVKMEKECRTGQRRQLRLLIYRLFLETGWSLSLCGQFLELTWLVHLRLYSQNRATASNSCLPCTNRSGQMLWVWSQVSGRVQLRLIE